MKTLMKSAVRTVSKGQSMAMGNVTVKVLRGEAIIQLTRPVDDLIREMKVDTQTKQA